MGFLSFLKRSSPLAGSVKKQSRGEARSVASTAGSRTVSSIYSIGEKTHSIISDDNLNAKSANGSAKSSESIKSTWSILPKKNTTKATNEEPPATMILATKKTRKTRKKYFDEGSNKPLEKEIAEFINTVVVPNADEKTLQVMAETTRDLCDSQVAERALKIGQRIPNFSLPNGDGLDVSIQDEIKDYDYTVIVFYRGNWCPFCNFELAAYSKAAEFFAEENVNILAISPNLPDVSKTMKEAKNLPYKVLSDVGNQVGRQFGIVFVMAEALRPIFRAFGSMIPEENGDSSYEIPLASKFVVDKTGQIVYSHIEADFTRRPEPEEILQKIVDYDMERPLSCDLTVNAELNVDQKFNAD